MRRDVVGKSWEFWLFVHSCRLVTHRVDPAVHHLQSSYYQLSFGRRTRGSVWGSAYIRPKGARGNQRNTSQLKCRHEQRTRSVSDG